jgi:hypothetical protein
MPTVQAVMRFAVDVFPMPKAKRYTCKLLEQAAQA